MCSPDCNESESFSVAQDESRDFFMWQNEFEDHPEFGRLRNTHKQELSLEIIPHDEFLKPGA